MATLHSSLFPQRGQRIDPRGMPGRRVACGRRRQCVEQAAKRVLVKWYWLVTNHNTVPDGDEERMLDECRSIDSWRGKAWIRAANRNNGGDPNDNLQNRCGLLIFPQRLQIALADAGIGGIQYLPIQVPRPDGTRLEGFCIANILDCVDALDLKRSTYRRYPDDYFLPERRGQLNSLRQVTLHSKFLQGRDVVRLSEFKDRSTSPTASEKSSTEGTSPACHSMKWVSRDGLRESASGRKKGGKASLNWVAQTLTN